MTNINGQRISKTVNGWVVDGVQAYLARDGVSLVTGSGHKLAILTEAEISGFRAQEAAHKAPAATRLAKERAYDLGYNEGGEGFNPHRFGAAKTYRR